MRSPEQRPGAGGGRGGGPGGGFGGGQPTLIRIAGASGVTAKEDTRQLVVDEYAPVGARSFKVASARGFRPGDTVIVRRIGNADWIAAVGMNGETPQSRWQSFNVDWDRVVTDVQGNTITIDAPITCAIEKRWGGGEVMKYEDPGRLEKVGIENLRGISEFDPTVRTKEYGNMDRPNYVAEEYDADENHYSNFITFDNIKHGWVRNATALHFVNSMVGAARGSKWITVQDCVSREPISRRMGARRFTFALRGQLALVQRCHSDKGRHSFMMGQPTASGNVFLDCTATNPYSSSEPHEQWATGGLYDNVRGAAHGAVLEEHQHRLGRRQHRLLELRRLVPRAEAARRRRITRSATSASMPSCSTSRSRIRRRKADTSNRWTGTSRRAVCT